MRMLIEIVRQSLATLWAHKLRSFLTMFGIAWGVGSLLLLVGLGEGFRSGQAKQLKNLGQDIMFTFPGRIPAVEGSTQSGRTYHFTYEDYLAIRSEARSLKYLSPVLNREDIRAVSDYGSTNGQVFGIAPEYNQIRNVPVGPGRWFNDEDNAETRRVAVVGWELLKNIFPGRPAVGSPILLNGIRFEIIGVLSKVGQDGNNGTNARIFLPIETMRNLFRLKEENSEDAISFLNYRPFAPADHLAAKQEVHEIIARRHGFDPKLEESFEDWDTIENNQRVAKIFDGMDWFLGVVGVVTLALGAIGIINIMLVSVTERTREIGLRKAARRHPSRDPDPVFCGRRVPDRSERRHWTGHHHRIGDGSRHVARARRIRHAPHRSIVGGHRDSFARGCRHRRGTVSGAPGRAAGAGGGAAPGVTKSYGGGARSSRPSSGSAAGRGRPALHPAAKE